MMHSTYIVHEIGEVPELGPELDSWHYAGFHSDTLETKHGDFIELCEKKLPEMVLPIHINEGGYIHRDDPSVTIPDGWCHDKYGRLVVSFEGKIIFARYQTHYFFVIEISDTIYRRMTEEEMKEMMAKLNNL